MKITICKTAAGWEVVEAGRVIYTCLTRESARFRVKELMRQRGIAAYRLAHPRDFTPSELAMAAKELQRVL